MGPFEIPGFIIGMLLFIVIAIILGQRNVMGQNQSILYLGIFIRIVAVLAYSTVVFTIYRGAADPVLYYRWGVTYSEYFSQFDFSPFFDQTLWRSPRFVGTNFIGYPAAFVVMIVGESFRGAWLLFSILSFMGLIFIAKTFFRAYGPVDYKRYLTILILLPPLWFWTASISKDSWVLFGVGLFLLGFIQRDRRKRSLIGMGFGIFFCFLARPQIAAMLAFAVAGSYFLMSFRKLTFQNVVVLAFATGGAFYFLSVIGIGADGADIQSFAISQRQYSSYGGSTIQQSTGMLAFVMAPVNILLRPFPWEVGGFLQIITFLELYFIWFLVLKNWKSVRRSIRYLRKDPLIAFSVVFIGLFSVGAGLALSNLGLIARQRIILYPFILIIIYAYSDKRLNYLRKKRQARIKAMQNA